MSEKVDLRLFLKDWLAWATSGDTETPSPEGVFYGDRYGLCRSAIDYSAATERALPPGSYDPKVLQAWLGFTCPYPFGKDNYDARIWTDSQHLDPARLMWVRNKIAKLENVPEEPKPDSTLNGQPTGRDQELEDMRAINIALQAEIDDLKKYDVRQILVDMVPGLDGQGQEVYAQNVAQVVEILSSLSLENEDLKQFDVRRVVIGRVPGLANPIVPIFARDVAEVERLIESMSKFDPSKCDHHFCFFGDQARRRCAKCATLEVLPETPGPAVELPDHHLDPKPDETPYV